MTSILQPYKIPQLKNLDKLEEVLTGIWSGKLEHTQDSFYCGTACCVAGWLVVLNTELGKALPPDKREKTYKGDPFASAYLSDFKAFLLPWGWSADFLGLTPSEASLLFDESTSRALQELTLEALKAGRRLRDYVPHTWPDSYDSDSLELECDTFPEITALSDFLGIDTITYTSNYWVY